MSHRHHATSPMLIAAVLIGLLGVSTTLAWAADKDLPPSCVKVKELKPETDFQARVVATAACRNDLFISQINLIAQKSQQHANRYLAVYAGLLNSRVIPLSQPDADRLGETIFLANPYPTYGPDPWGYEVNFDDLEMQETPGNWNFKGAPHYIRRAIRVPYTYYRLTENSTADKVQYIEVKDYFLVGFEGGGAY